MTKTLTTATGLEIPVLSAVKGSRFDYILHVRTASLDAAQAARIFAEPAETEQLRFDDGNRRAVFSGYVRLLSVGPSPMASSPGELLIRLAKEE